MSRRLTASVMFGLAMTLVAFAQQPSEPRPAEKKVDKKAANPLDSLIGAALANDPDVKVAHAKLQMAEAELTRARHLVTQKVVALESSIREQKKAVATAEQAYVPTNEAYKRGQASLVDMLAAREKLETAQSKLALLETELKILTGSNLRAGGGDVDGWKDLSAVHKSATWDAGCMACHTANTLKPGVATNAESALQALAASFHGHAFKAPAGPMSDRIRAALDKPVKLGPKDAKVTFEQALESFKKDAGLDVPVRAEFKVSPIVCLGEELPVGAWLQLYADGSSNIRILVREYGLLVTSKDAAPPDAMSVFDFWKQKPEKKQEAAGK